MALHQLQPHAWLQGIEARDGYPCDIDNLWLTDGASPAVHYMMKALLRNEQVGWWAGSCGVSCMGAAAECQSPATNSLGSPLGSPHFWRTVSPLCTPLQDCCILCPNLPHLLYSAITKLLCAPPFPPHTHPHIPCLQDCILCPIPQYPLYSATIKLYGGTLLPYYLEEGHGWQATLAHLREQVQTARRYVWPRLMWGRIGRRRCVERLQCRRGVGWWLVGVVPRWRWQAVANSLR